MWAKILSDGNSSKWQMGKNRVDEPAGTGCESTCEDGPVFEATAKHASKCAGARGGRQAEKDRHSLPLAPSVPRQQKFSHSTNLHMSLDNPPHPSTSQVFLRFQTSADSEVPGNPTQTKGSKSHHWLLPAEIFIVPTSKPRCACPGSSLH